MQLVNQSVIHVMHYLNQGIYPNILKFTTVKLIYKKGEKSTVFYYRHISLLTTFSKILEKVMYNRFS